MPKLVFHSHIIKIIVGDYGFKYFKVVKTVVTNYDFKLKVKILVGDSSYEKILND